MHGLGRPLIRTAAAERGDDGGQIGLQGSDLLPIVLQVALDPGHAPMDAVLVIGMGTLLARQPRDGVRLSADLAYGEHPRQRLDVYQPEAAATGLRPVLVFVHGGGFVSGAKEDINNGEYGQILRQMDRGYAVVTVNYRLATQAPFPAARDDVALAIAHLRANGATMGLNVGRLIVAGHSAGGSLAAMIGTNPGAPTQFGSVPRVDEYVAISPITIFNGDGVAPMPSDFWVPSAQRAAQSPLTTLDPSDPRGYIIHGDLDGIVPVAHADRFMQKAATAGAKVTFDRVDDGATSCRNHLPMCGANAEYLDNWLG